MRYGHIQYLPIPQRKVCPPSHSEKGFLPKDGRC